MWTMSRLGAVRPAFRRAGAVFAALLALPALTALGGTPTASAFSRAGLPVEYLDVYSAAMGRNIRVQFQTAGAAPAATSNTGGSAGAAPAATTNKAVYLLDGMRARDDFSGWDVNTQAFEWFVSSGISTVMPVGGEASFYSDWYSPSSFNDQPYTYKWETFLTRELPAFLASAKHVSPTGNGVVGLSMAGGAGLILSAYHPAQFTYAASLSGFLNPSTLFMKQAIRVAMLGAGGYNVDDMWGPPWDAAWKRNDPLLQVARIVGNGTRLWIYCAPGGGPVDENVDPGQEFDANSLESLAINGNKRFQERYVAAGGTNATFQFPSAGNHSWAFWGQQLQTLEPDLIATLNG
jgi:diacylglycerol O-acyltransferase/trehalose O-mycolyltransferase